ncbi:MAG: DUF167 domain-containing protein [Acidimicrobiia bacterium]|nr:DUF167 domain-containing protein [Acidimicrobiia bacterium]
MTVPSYLEPHPDGALLTVWVVPGARRTEVVGPHGDALKIRVAAPPEAGKANRELAKLLERVTGASVTLARGTTSRRKLLLIEGVSPEQIAACLEPTRP